MKRRLSALSVIAACSTYAPEFNKVKQEDPSLNDVLTFKPTNDIDYRDSNEWIPTDFEKALVREEGTFQTDSSVILQRQYVLNETPRRITYVLRGNNLTWCYEEDSQLTICNLPGKYIFGTLGTIRSRCVMITPTEKTYTGCYPFDDAAQEHLK